MAEEALVTVVDVVEVEEALVGAEVVVEASEAVAEEEEEDEVVSDLVGGMQSGGSASAWGSGRKRWDVPVSLHLCLVGGGFQSGGNRGRGRGGKRGNQSGKNVMVEPHRHEGE